MLISGEAGIGKTTLVGGLAVDGVEVIRASCLPLASLTSPLLALRAAIPDGSAFGPDDRAASAFDAWLDRAAARRPVVLAVDDVHWADESTLDVLMYVIAAEDRPESHSISFASLVYYSAWFKHYYPAAFCAALLNSQPMGFYSPQCWSPTPAGTACWPAGPT